MKPRCACALVVALFGLPCVQLGAQDVIVGEPGWALADPAPEVMPKNTGRMRPDFPEELQKTSEIGYVLLLRHVDVKGKQLTMDLKATQPPYERAVTDAI